MFSIPSRKRFFASLILLAFLLSANALFFGHHAAKEMAKSAAQGRDAEVCFASSLLDLPTQDHHHHSDGGHSHGDEGCCGSHGHSHDLKGAPPTLELCAISSLPVTFIEPAVFLPEVFLDRFIPPQNLA